MLPGPPPAASAAAAVRPDLPHIPSILLSPHTLLCLLSVQYCPTWKLW